MSIGVVILLGIGLSMDAFAVAVCKGLAMKKLTWREAFICGLWFGAFQALMPLIGYLIGGHFQKYIEEVDHWIAFGLLVILGVNMFKESFTEEISDDEGGVGVREMILPAIATSIDALAVGITFAFLKSGNVYLSVALIGCITCALSVVGVKVGNIFGTRYRSVAQRLGAVILVLIGVKILLEHLGIIPPLF